MRSHKFRARMRHMDAIKTILDAQGYYSPSAIVARLHGTGYAHTGPGKQSWTVSDVLAVQSMGFLGAMASAGQLDRLADILAASGWTRPQVAHGVARAHFRKPDGTTWTKGEARSVLNRLEGVTP